RYFPEPDLAPVTTTDEEIEAVKRSLGELPRQIRDRLEAEYKIPAYDADVIVNQGQPTVSYYESLAQLSGDGKLASNWVQQEVLRVLKERSLEIDAFPVSTERLAELVKAIAGKEIDGTRAKDVFAEMLDSGKSAAEVMKEMGIEKVDDSALETMCRELLEANPKVLADLKEGKHKAVGALIGQAKKKNPNIDPGTFRQMCIDMSADM
ncbi:MAG: Asp-tRNA(Asn)/Glu-tRNA(Gln) amidotransferase GatCAB subunit B, partial [Blastopirellula sp. JB062]